MTPCDTYDASVEDLKRLQPLLPDRLRADRVRMRCRAQLLRSQKRQASTDVIARSAWRVLAPVVVGGFCVLYTLALVIMTLRLRGVLH